MRKAVIIIFALAFICISACNNTKRIKGNVEMLFKNQWNLTELYGQKIEETHNQNPNLLFVSATMNKVSGSTGCNRLSGSFELPAGNTIKFSPLAVTKMACPGNITEIKFLEAIEKVNNWAIENNHLLLGDDKTTLLKFEAALDKATSSSVMDTAMLIGTWELDYISGPRIAFDGLYPGKKPYVYFDFTDTLLRGNTSCNGFSSKIEVKENKIKIADPLKTMMFCGGDGENTFIEMLKKIDSYSVSDNRDSLTFIMDDIAVMRFHKNENLLEK
ncbi:MAG: META domain-containing protein [Ginsengibacter sp.]